MSPGLEGFCQPLSPEGKAQLMGAPPWHYSLDMMVINYRADPDAVKKHIPEPLEPSSQPDSATVTFPTSLSLWDSDKDMIFINPERTKYTECIIYVDCRYQGVEGQKIAYIWVDNDFTMLRGWFMGAPKKLGRIHLSYEKRHLYELNAALGKFGTGTRLKGFLEADGERLVTATMTLGKQISPEELPASFSKKNYNIIHFPDIEIGATKPLVHRLVEHIADTRIGEVWEATDATLAFTESEIEEHIALQPRQITSAYFLSMGFTHRGTRLLHEY